MRAASLLERLPSEVREFIARISGHPSLRDAFLVGGTVRDLLLDRPVRDLDLAVGGDALTAGRELADALGGHFVPLSEAHHVARVVLDDGPVRIIDLATLRGAIEDDLRKRDFTIDAVAIRLDGQGEVVDPAGGVGDARRRTLRAVTHTVFDDDPLRLLRLVRLSAELGCRIDPETEALACSKAAALPRAAPERRRDELVRLCATDRAGQGLRSMDRLGLLAVELPEVCAGKGVAQPVEHYYDVFEHALATVETLDALLARSAPDGRLRPVWDALWEAFAFADLRTYLDEEPVPGRPRMALLKLAGLLHDVAKPQTRAPDETGRIRFFGHAELGARVAQRILRRLRFSHRECAWVATLVQEHLRPLQLAAPGEAPTRRALARFFRHTGDAATGLLLLSLADHLAARGPRADEAGWRAHIDYLAWILRARIEEEGFVRPRRLVTGHDVMGALRIGPGPEVGRLLRAVEAAQEAGDVSTREEALTLIRRLAAGGHDGP